MALELLSPGAGGWMWWKRGGVEGRIVYNQAVLSLILFLLQAVLPAQAPAPSPAASEARLAVEVLDAKGVPKTDLKPEDLAVSEGGEPRHVVHRVIQVDVDTPLAARTQ